MQELADQYEKEIEQIFKDTADKIHAFTAQLKEQQDCERLEAAVEVRPAHLATAQLHTAAHAARTMTSQGHSAALHAFGQRQCVSCCALPLSALGCSCQELQAKYDEEIRNNQALREAQSKALQEKEASLQVGTRVGYTVTISDALLHGCINSGIAITQSCCQVLECKPPLCSSAQNAACSCLAASTLLCLCGVCRPCRQLNEGKQLSNSN